MSSSMWPLVRAVRGPVMLIALGVLFLIDQAGGLSFQRSWPILLVLYGALKLIERMIAPPPAVPWQPMPPQTHWVPPAGTPPAQPPPPFGGGPAQ